MYQHQKTDIVYETPVIIVNVGCTLFVIWYKPSHLLLLLLLFPSPVFRHSHSVRTSPEVLVMMADTSGHTSGFFYMLQVSRHHVEKTTMP